MNAVAPTRLAMAVCLALSFFVLTPQAALAQDNAAGERDFADPSAEQLSLNDDAVRAIIQEDYARAVALLEEASALGELNVTYLNLGRAYQMLGKCAKAKEALGNALTAPRVRKPSPAFVKKKVAEYREELPETCPSEKPAETAAKPEDKETADEDPSKDAAEAKDEAKPDKAVAANKTKEKADQPEPIEPPQVEESGSNITGWVLTLSGAAVAAGGGTLFLLAEMERDPIRSQPERGDGVVTDRTMRDAQAAESRANMYDTVGVAALATGTTVAGVGLYLLFSGDAEADASTVSVGVAPEGAQVQWKLKF